MQMGPLVSLPVEQLGSHPGRWGPLEKNGRRGSARGRPGTSRPGRASAGPTSPPKAAAAGGPSVARGTVSASQARSHADDASQLLGRLHHSLLSPCRLRPPMGRPDGHAVEAVQGGSRATRGGFLDLGPGLDTLQPTPEPGLLAPEQPDARVHDLGVRPGFLPATPRTVRSSTSRTQRPRFLAARVPC